MSEYSTEFYFIDFEKFYFTDNENRIKKYFKEHREIEGIKI